MFRAASANDDVRIPGLGCRKRRLPLSGAHLPARCQETYGFHFPKSSSHPSLVLLVVAVLGWPTSYLGIDASPRLMELLL
ncbi:uncharacterized protein AKAW2_40333A [Aspergillus luchuensis]|uniref:Uncharacterized protein n=1 Tax=Aspergillus kawachii TaxID=1069201 RepID=A0A7R7W946_ASPKA|nr:uncharacterized protein AKAW2_40333A [Aspergillus luchuensis]BCR98650.1 hypothetical protein AKAW2_40333A [Aspergillus luchuensis]